MATYTVQRYKHATLSAATVDTVNLTKRKSGVEVINRSTSDTIYIRFDGIAPAVGADETIVVMAGAGYAKLSPADSVKLISSGTPDYSVQVVD